LYWFISIALLTAWAFQTTTIDTVSEFTRRSATGNCKWRAWPRSLCGS